MREIALWEVAKAGLMTTGVSGMKEALMLGSVTAQPSSLLLPEGAEPPSLPRSQYVPLTRSDWCAAGSWRMPTTVGGSCMYATLAGGRSIGVVAL